MVFFCIADKESSLGFKLAGIPTREASNRAEALEALQEAWADKNTGVILVTDRAAAYIEDEIKVHLDNKPIPLVLKLASRGQKPSRKSSSELLKGLGGIGA